MLLFLNFLKRKNKEENLKKQETQQTNQRIATRKGELGEYKIDLQLNQLPSEYRFLNDLLIKNPKAKSGYSQIDHVVITPYGIFTIETKNYQGTIYGQKDRKTWLVNGKFQMMNPFVQNYGHIKALESLLDKKHANVFISIVSFTKRCKLNVDVDYYKIASSDEIIVYDVELFKILQHKISVLQNKHKEPILSATDILTIYNAFSNAHVTDPKAIESHKEVLKSNSTKKQATCSKCKKPVSDNVKRFCLSNKKFKGKIY
ncbi:nuclease-related domain-containing protein [Pseudalkalibacillus caeni]|uniref:NERD domain-containing protein n=1 Tax=Exobacillus caeni TaxID=2574798 RepID=A0A5R9FCL1_9BACL|nr:nuclease-related domain-containing protein [Pseudalkalibacillus caeni]TLS38613.1 NERD domain-containing protein [Pseudalkalibacillus caeni]